MKRENPRAQSAKILEIIGKSFGLENLLENPSENLFVCGSWRRGCPTIGDLDLVLLRSWQYKLRAIPWLTVTKKTATGTVRGTRIEIFITEPRNLGAALIHATGPADYNVGLRRIAKSKGYKLNQYGLTNRQTGEWIAGTTEESIMTALGQPYLEPAERSADKLV